MAIMNKRLRIIRALVGGAIGAAVFTGVYEARADTWMKWNHKSGDILYIEVGNNLDSRWHPNLERAVAEWSANKEGNPVRLKIVPGANLPDCGTVAGRIEICNRNMGDTSWGGATWADTGANGNVTAMRIILNDYYHPNDGAWDRDKNRQWITCHELGHAIGFHHDTTGRDLGTCMDYSGVTISPQTQDYKSLSEMYGRFVPKYFSVRVGGIAR